MVAYGASKSFDMVFAEALWGELKPAGVDVLGLILGERLMTLASNRTMGMGS
jgi:short-subunit dehydrogenase